MESFVIGDIHGQIDFLKVMLDQIKQKAKGKEHEIILAGDILDRGKDSYATYQFIKNLSQAGSPPTTHLLGNHDDFFSGSDTGTDQLIQSMQHNANGVLRTIQSAFDYYANGDISKIIGKPGIKKGESEIASISLAKQVFQNIKQKTDIFENPKYKKLFSKLEAHGEEAKETLDFFTRWNDEDTKVFMPGVKGSINSMYSKKDEASIFFLYKVLHDMKNYFSNLPLIAQRHTENSDFAITHSGFVPTEKDAHGNDVRILTDAEIKANPSLRDEALWARSFFTKRGQETSAPREKAMNHLIVHGHSVNESDLGCAATTQDGTLTSINLDAGAYKNPPAFRCLYLQTGQLTSFKGTEQNEVLMKDYQLRKKVAESELPLTPLSEKTVPLAPNTTGTQNDDKSQ